MLGNVYQAGVALFFVYLMYRHQVVSRAVTEFVFVEFFPNFVGHSFVCFASFKATIF